METLAFRPSILHALLLVAASMAACASPPGGGALQFADTRQASDVTVSVDAEALQGDRRAAFIEQGGAKKLVDGIFQKLQGRTLAGPVELKVAVTRFRLRSGSSGFWLGPMAGADVIAVTVDVVRDDKSERNFSTDTSTAVGGVIRPGSVERFDRMINTLSQRIVDGL